MRLNAHHIKDFASNIDGRYDLSNGITLCASCHDTTVAGSFYNLYGTHQKTSYELEEYINKKRRELGIAIPFNIDSYQSDKILKSDDLKGNFQKILKKSIALKLNNECD